MLRSQTKGTWQNTQQVLGVQKKKKIFSGLYTEIKWLKMEWFILNYNNCNGNDMNGKRKTIEDRRIVRCMYAVSFTFGSTHFNTSWAQQFFGRTCRCRIIKPKNKINCCKHAVFHSWFVYTFAARKWHTQWYGNEVVHAEIASELSSRIREIKKNANWGKKKHGEWIHTHTQKPYHHIILNNLYLSLSLCKRREKI